VKAGKVLSEHWLILAWLELLHLVGNKISTDGLAYPESNVFSNSHQVDKITGFCVEPGQNIVNMQEEAELWMERVVVLLSL
jgi:hypothetical protein